jgi:hypothetical protein
MDIDDKNMVIEKLYYSNNYEALIQHCDDLIETDPSDIKAWNYKGISLYKLEKIYCCPDVL